MSLYQKHKGGTSSNQPVINYSALKKIKTLSYFNLHTYFQHDEFIKGKMTDIYNSLYVNALYLRPLFFKMISFDLFSIKSRNLKSISAFNNYDFCNTGF